MQENDIMKIRKFEHSDTEELVTIWYNASVIAHCFIPNEMWESHKEELRNKYLPIAETWVAEESGILIGFISLLGNYIGGNDPSFFHTSSSSGLPPLKIIRSNSDCSYFS